MGSTVPSSEEVNRLAAPGSVSPAAFGIAVVRGRSMEPALRDGDRLLIRYGGSPRPGRLVIVRLAGRPVSVKRATGRTEAGWWVERDNPDEGVDSWLLGAIPDTDVLATVLCRIWPPRRYPRQVSPPD